MVSACSNPNAPATDIISVHAESRRLAMTNTSSDPVYYFVADQDALALIDWMVCVEPGKCESIPPQSTKALDYSKIGAYQEGSKHAVVYHWRLVPKNGPGFKPDSIRSLVVELH
jgi:hypothetical protein